VPVCALGFEGKYTIIWLNRDPEGHLPQGARAELGQKGTSQPTKALYVLMYGFSGSYFRVCPIISYLDSNPTDPVSAKSRKRASLSRRAASAL
jgi:hypothetical protein